MNVAAYRSREAYTQTTNVVWEMWTAKKGTKPDVTHTIVVGERSWFARFAVCVRSATPTVQAVCCHQYKQGPISAEICLCWWIYLCCVSLAPKAHGLGGLALARSGCCGLRVCALCKLIRRTSSRLGKRASDVSLRGWARCSEWALIEIPEWRSCVAWAQKTNQSVWLSSHSAVSHRGSDHRWHLTMSHHNL